MAQHVKITLEVDTDKLFINKGRPSRNQVVTACKLSDDNGGKAAALGCLLFFIPAKRVKSFTTNIGPNSVIQWVGISKNSNDAVSIDSIVYRYSRHSTNFFDTIVLQPSAGAGKIVKEEVRAGKSLGQYEYFINFKVEYLGKWHDFQIDPRLKMHAYVDAGQG